MKILCTYVSFMNVYIMCRTVVASNYTPALVYNGGTPKGKRKEREMEFDSFKSRVAYFNARARKAKADGYQVVNGSVYTVPDKPYKEFPKLVCSVYEYCL